LNPATGQIAAPNNHHKTETSMNPRSKAATGQAARSGMARCTMARCTTAMRAAALALLTLAASPVHAEAPYPNKPIRIVVPYPAGGSTDTLARTLGDTLSQRLGQPVVVGTRAARAGSSVPTTSPSPRQTATRC
jgi:hypothetical protein